MIAYKRRQSIIELLRKQPGLRVYQMAERLGVSEGTIRSDLNLLEKNGHLTRYHGGAILKEQFGLYDTSFSGRHHVRATEKEQIARQAAQLVRDGDSILLDASSTVYYLGLSLQGRQRLRVVTNGVDVARLLAQNASNTVILIGGVMNQEGSSVTGLFGEQNMREIHVQKAFVSCSGFSLETGMTEVHLAEAQLKRKMIASSETLFALLDSSKFGKEDLTPFAKTDQVTHLFTDPGLTSEWVSRLERAGIPFTICESAEVPQNA